MKLELNRTYYTHGTNGDLLLKGERVCSTIELPWKNNAARMSCIPEGKYELRKRYSPRFGNHFILMDVPNRSFILIHPGNVALLDLKGCIAPVSKLAGEGMGTESRMALTRLKGLVYPALSKGEKVWLVIRSVQGKVSS
jgi:hypothetical protein